MKKKYPWKDWFSSEEFVVRENIEYDCLTFTMNMQIRNMAVKKGVLVSIHHSKCSTGDVLTVKVKGAKIHAKTA